MIPKKFTKTVLTRAMISVDSEESDFCDVVLFVGVRQNVQSFDCCGQCDLTSVVTQEVKVSRTDIQSSVRVYNMESLSEVMSGEVTSLFIKLMSRQLLVSMQGMPE